ncbi:MAG: DUF6603 domain-containing protein [Bacteroidota bacterium]
MGYSSVCTNIDNELSSGNSLTLTDTLLECPHATSLFQESFKSDTVSFEASATSLEKDPDNSSISLLPGAVSLYDLVSLPATLRILEDAEGNAQFTLTIGIHELTLPDILTQYFPYSANIASFVSGLSFLPQLSLILDSSQRSWTASWKPEVTLFQALDIPGLNNLQITLESLALTTTGIGVFVQRKALLRASFSFSTSGTIELDISLPIHGDGYEFVIVGGATSPSLQDFFNAFLFHGSLTTADLLPSSLQDFLAGIHLIRASIGFSSAFVPQSFQLTVGSTEAWYPLTGADSDPVALNDWSLSANFQKFGTSYSKSFFLNVSGLVFSHQLSGQIGITDVYSFSIYNEDQASPLDKDSVSDFFDSVPYNEVLPVDQLFEGSSLSIRSIELQFTPGNGLDFIRIRFTASTHFQVKPNPAKPESYVSGNLDLTAQYTAGKTTPTVTQASYDVNVSGSLLLDTFPIYFVASYEKAELAAGFDLQANCGPISLGNLMLNMQQSLGPDDLTIPTPLKEYYVDEAEIAFHSTSGMFSFHLLGSMPVGNYGRAQTELYLTRDSLGGAFSIEGVFNLEERRFSFGVESGATETNLVALYHNSMGEKVVLKEMVEYLSTDVAEVLPDSLSISLTDVFLAYEKSRSSPPEAAKTSQALMGLTLSIALDLAELPVIGRAFPAGTHAGIDALSFVLASKPWTEGDVSSLNPPITSLSPGDLYRNADPAVHPNLFEKGINIVATFRLGNATKSILVPLGAAKQQQSSNPQSNPVQPASPTPTDSTPAATAATVESNPTTVSVQKPSYGAQWLNIQRGLGPVMVERIGVSFKDGTLWFLIDASLKMGPLTLSLEGLSLGSPIDHFEPKFDLKGILIDLKRNNLEIGGALLKSDPPPAGVKYEYDGYAIVRFKQLSIVGLGSYAKLQDNTISLFAYIAVDYPIGGPAWFYVTGLSGGFGVNRRLVPPALAQMDQFPLVSSVLQGTTQSTTGNNSNDRQVLTTQLTLLKKYIPPSKGNYFLAAGLKFTSFKLLNGFGLLAVNFGHRFRVDVFGRLWMVHPPVDPKMVMSNNPLAGLGIKPYLVYVEIDLHAAFIPDEGILLVEGAIKPGSFVYSPLATIAGSFSFRGWFLGPHAGDFVFVLGGYHKDYKPPAHYPQRNQLKMLDIRYGVDDRLYVGGQLYFALTPAAFMVGGTLHAVFNLDPLHATFDMYADFLIYWKPYHYDIRIGIEAHIEFRLSTPVGTIQLDVSLGASLRVYGPEMSGTAEVHFHGLSKTIQFGSGSSTAPPGISWTEFQKSFLPKESDRLSFVCEQGLIKPYEESNNNIWGVNRRTVQIGLTSAVPGLTAELYIQQSDDSTLSTATEAETHDLGTANPFGIFPMHIDPDRISSTIRLEVTHKGNPIAQDQLRIVPIYKPIPSGMWGNYQDHRLNKASLLPEALTGLRISPGTPSTPGSSHAVDRNNLLFDTEILHDKSQKPPVPSYAFHWETPIQFSDDQTPEDILASLKQDLPESDTFQHFTGLISEEDLSSLNLSEFISEIDSWTAIPRIGQLV